MKKRHKPTIVLRSGQQHRAVDKISKILRSNSERRRIFQRGGELVQITVLAEKHEDLFLRRPKGSLQLRPVTATNLADTFSRIARWRRGDKRIDCPQRIANTFLALPGKWHVPVLAGLVTAPILRLATGTVLDKPGYDNETQLFLMLDGDWPKVPDKPTRADAERALEKLLSPFAQFPWVSEADKAVHVAAILTAIERRLLGPCPIFGYSAPAPRSGKSMLAECVAIIAIGTAAPANAVARDREELRKMVTSTLREGHQITNLDNVPDGQPLFSPDLAKAITQTKYQDRILGESRMLTLLTNVLWTATGNNLRFKGDLASRALRCSIDSLRERPEERIFRIPKLQEHVKQMRRDLVVAGLTILRAYHLARSPRQNVSPWGGFDEWSRAIREPLVWLGMSDPYFTRMDVIEDDPDTTEAMAIFRALHDEFGNSTFKTRDIIKRCDERPTLSTLRIALAAISKDMEPRAVGNWLSRFRNRIVYGLRLVQEGKSGGAGRWSIRKVGSQVVTGSRNPAIGVKKRYPRY